MSELIEIYDEFVALLHDLVARDELEPEEARALAGSLAELGVELAEQYPLEEDELREEEDDPERDLSTALEDDEDEEERLEADEDKRELEADDEDEED